jgi:hypothetical protein
MSAYEIEFLKIDGSSDALISLLTHIFDLVVTRKAPHLWKSPMLFLVLKKSHSSVASNYRPISLLKSFPIF